MLLHLLIISQFVWEQNYGPLTCLREQDLRTRMLYRLVCRRQKLRVLDFISYIFLFFSPSSLGSLQAKLSRQDLVNVSFMIVNEKSPFSQTMYWKLKWYAPEGIPVFQQEILEPDVWQILDGDKDDFLIYDKSVLLNRQK